MKKIFMVIVTLCIGVSMAGCSESEKTEDTTASGVSIETVLATETTGFELVLGSIKLEETDLAIDVDQTQELIPLWQAYAALSQSDITAQAELDAVLKQIMNTMTAEQMELINSWELSAQDMQSLMNEYGIEIGRGNGDGTGQDFNPEDRPEGFEPGQGMGGGQGLRPGGGMGEVVCQVLEQVFLRVYCRKE